MLISDLYSAFYGEDILSGEDVRTLEYTKTRYMKLQADTSFIKTCKAERLISTFANIKFSLKNNNYEVKQRIYRMIMESKSYRLQLVSLWKADKL